MKELPNESVNLIVTDPPYNVGKDYGNNSDKQSKEEYLKFSRDWLSEAHRLLKEDGTIYVCGGQQYSPHLFIIMEELGFVFNSWIVWHYTQGVGRTRGYSSRHDDILMFTKSKKYTFNLDAIRIPQKSYRKVNNMRGANPSNVWVLPHIHYSEESRTEHPTQKPHAIFERMILSSSNEGDIVLDPFCGSGSSLVVSMKTNRKFIGMELEEKYVMLSRSELEKDYKYFNSCFSELTRVPDSFSDKDLAVEYLTNHRKWFLDKYHSNLVPSFEKNIVKQYGEDVFNKYLSNYKK